MIEDARAMLAPGFAEKLAADVASPKRRLPASMWRPPLIGER